jgi:hypothetical protein
MFLCQVTIASVRAHGVRQVLVYCLGKREGDWPCHHLGKLPINRFQAEEVLQDSRWRGLICDQTTAKAGSTAKCRLDDAARKLRAAARMSQDGSKIQ